MSPSVTAMLPSDPAMLFGAIGYAHSRVSGALTRIMADNGTGGLTDTVMRDLQFGRLLFGVTCRATDRASINPSVKVGVMQDAPDVRSVLRLPLLLAGK